MLAFLSVKLGGLAVVVVGVLAVVSDTITAAAIAGLFSVLNTIIGAFLLREQRRVRKVLAAPRQMVYDAAGRPIGTVLDLRTHAPEWLSEAA